MKTVIFVRHAKATSRKLDIPDFERSLQKKGIKEAKKIAGILKEDGIQADLLISSPANRALETAHIFAEELGYPVQKVVIKETLYNETSHQKILEVVRETDDKYSRIMLFGHNPSFDDIAHIFVNNFDENIATSGVVGIQFKNKTWKNISKGKGELKFYEYPIRKSEKNQVYKSIRKQIEGRISKQISNLFAEFDGDASQKINDLIDQTGKKLTSKFLKNMKTYKAKRISEDFLKASRSKRRSKKATPKAKVKINQQTKKATTGSKSKRTTSQKKLNS